MKKKLLIIVSILAVILNIGIVNAASSAIYVECEANDSDENWAFVKFTSSESGADRNQYWYKVEKDKDGTLKKGDKLNDCWIADPTDKDEKCKKVDNYNTTSQLNQGICPSIFNGKTPIGIGKTIKAIQLDGNNYVFFGYKDKNDKFTSINGIYYTKNGEFNSTRYYLGIIKPQTELLEEYGENFFKIGNFVDNDFINNHIKNICVSGNKTIGQCDDKNKDFEIIFDSGNNFNKLKSAVDTWYKDNESIINKEKNDYDKIQSNYGTLIKTCEAFNEKMSNSENYVFSNSYDANKTLSDLTSVYSQINGMYDITVDYKLCSNGESAKALNSAANCAVTKLLGVGSESAETITKSLNALSKNGYALVVEDVAKILENYGINSSTTSEVDNSLATFATCSSYLDKYADEYNLDKTETSNLRKNYETLAEKRNITIVIDCEGLLGQKLIEKIKSYLNIIKIIIPIILIGLGIVDFARAMFAGTEENMKKAQQTFIKRLLIAVLIFFVPTIVEIILNIANKVWGFISPDTCGLF